MSAKILCLLVLISTLIQNGHTFWWQPTTKSPETVLKQIPLTYFRTYTYQPLVANPFAYPFFGSNNAGGFATPAFASQSPPLLSGSRYHAHASPQLTPEPSTTSTTSTTTTTTTTTTPAPPRPPTTTSTTTTTAAPTTTTATPTNGGDYPAYNRRLYSSAFNQLKIDRPSYPYPEHTLGHTSTSRIQFVPCMCPISVGITGELDSKTGFRDTFLAETRNAVNNDADLELTQDQEVTNLSIEKNEDAPTVSLEKSIAKEFSRSEEAQLINKVNLEPIEKITDDQRTLSELV